MVIKIQSLQLGTNPSKTPNIVVCERCKKEHFLDQDTFYTVFGNIHIGVYRGVIGNNINDKNKIYRAMFFCRDLRCLQKTLEYYDFK